MDTIDWSKPIRTRHGRHVAKLVKGLDSERFLGYYITEDLHQEPCVWDEYGFAAVIGLSIENVPRIKHTRWMNIYEPRHGSYPMGSSTLFTSEEEAEAIGKSNLYYLATARVEWMGDIT